MKVNKTLKAVAANFFENASNDMSIISLSEIQDSIEKSPKWKNVPENWKQFVRDVGTIMVFEIVGSKFLGYKRKQPEFNNEMKRIKDNIFFKKAEIDVVFYMTIMETLRNNAHILEDFDPNNLEDLKALFG